LEKNNQNLPLGWTEIPFHDAVTKIPLTGKKLKQKNYQKSGKFPVIDQGQQFIGGYTDNSSLKLVCELPVIIFGDHTRVFKFAEQDFVPGADGIKVIKPYKFFIPKLFYYFSHAIKFPKKGYARHYQHLEKSLIRIPPLNEQKRIVTKIEDLFSELEYSIENLNKIKIQLKQYHRSFLNNAFNGELTKTWREIHKTELKTSSTLAVKIQEEKKKITIKKFEEIGPLELSNLPKLPLGWNWIYLDSLLLDARYGTSTKCREESTGIPVIRIPNIISGKIDYSDLKYAESNEKNLESVLIRDNDLLICRTNGSLSLIGKTAIANNITSKIAFASYLIRLRPNNDLANSSYLNFIMEADIVRRVIEKRARTTAGQYNLNLDILRSIIIPHCSLEEQTVIISNIELTSSLISYLNDIVVRNTIHIVKLRQTILQTAFKGKLVPQDPNDEPASVLLEKIKQEKELQIKNTKSKSR